MNQGKPKRDIEVVPLDLPKKETSPIKEPVKQPAKKEPVKV